MLEDSLRDTKPGREYNKLVKTFQHIQGTEPLIKSLRDGLEGVCGMGASRIGCVTERRQLVENYPKSMTYFCFQGNERSSKKAVFPANKAKRSRKGGDCATDMEHGSFFRCNLILKGIPLLK